MTTENADQIIARIKRERGLPINSTKPPDEGTSGKTKAEAAAWRQGTFTAEQLQEMKFPPVSWIVPDIIPAEGVALLCSKPKFGKSWLAYDLCIACTMDRITLGEIRPAQGNVLYLALEDSKRRLQRRMTKLLPTFNAKWPSKLTLKTKWRRLHEGGLDDIRAWHKQTKDSGGDPIMVAIDVLAKVRKPTGNKQIYEADYEALGGLQQLAHEIGTAIVVIHHTRKMASDDLMETVSGSFSVTGVVDTVMVMASKASGAVLDVRGRDVESAELAIEFNKDACRWRILGDSAEIHVSVQRAKIIAALKEADAPMTTTALMEATEMKRNSLDLVLSRMAKAGDIKRIKTGLYAHKDYTPPPPDKPKRSVRSVLLVSDRQITGQIKEPPQATENKENKNAICPSVSSVRERADDHSQAPDIGPSVKIQTDRTDRQIEAATTAKTTAYDTESDLSGDQTDQTDGRRSDIEAPGVMAVNGFAISATPEDRKPPAPGQLSCRVWIKEIRHPAIKAGPDDNLDDFAAI